jgi:hypothetical protein
MNDYLTSPQAVAAIIAAITSILTLLITFSTKNFIEKKLLLFKLNAEHKFEQRKKIKNVLAENKSHLLEACENLNHRLWNFSSHDNFKWMNVGGEYKESGNYYFHSFAYRLLAMYGWIRKIEKDLIHLDATIASEDDFIFIKYLRFYGRLFCDSAFFHGYEFNRNDQIDHIFKNVFDELCHNVTENREILSYNEYLDRLPKIADKLFVLYRLLDGISPNEDRLRWERFQVLKMFNISFLNTYGYDYQRTAKEKIIKASVTPRKSKLYGNLIYLLREHKLDRQKEIKLIIRSLT